MFDLFRSREKSVRILLGALLVLVALSMLTYLIPSYDMGGSVDDVVVAEVGDDVITMMDVQRSVQNVMRGGQVPSELLSGYVPQMIESMITERALAYQAERLGYRVTDDDLAHAIQTVVPGLFQDGKFVGTETYAAMLAQQNLSIADFENELRRSLLVSRLRSLAVGGAVVSPAEIEEEYRRRNEKVKIEYVKVMGEKYAGEVQPDDQSMRTYFKSNAARYQVPEKKSLAILIADQSKLAQTVAPTEADLKRAYEENKESYRTPERVKVRHILLKTTGKPAAEEAKMKAQADDLLKQIKGGADFAALATKYSEDTGSAQNGGTLPDWVTRGQTVPEFEKTAFSLNPGQTSEPVKTEYGYHIIQVLEKEQARLRPFEEVKGELAEQWKKQRVNDVMQQTSERAYTTLQKEPANPDKVASELGMQLVRVQNVAPGDPLPEIGVNRDFDDSIAALRAGEVSQPVALPGEKIVLAVVTGVSPARPATFEEVQNQVRDAILQERLVDVVAKRATELAEKAKSMGGDLRKAAQSMGLEVRTSDDFTREGAVEGLGSASYVQEAFTKPDGSLLGPLGIADGRVVIRVLSHSPADMSQLAAQRDALRDEILSRKERDRGVLFEAGVRERLIKEGKIRIHQDVVNRLTASYRG
jgi:peptidyl-prolyl cis-trans isomerase D